MFHASDLPADESMSPTLPQNWVLKHITVMPLDAMRCSLKKSDSDLEVLEEYEQLTKGPINKRKIRPAPESESESEAR